MKIPLLSSVAIACAATAFAGQSTSPTGSNQSTTPSSANQTITLSGCVGRGANASDPFMLSNVTIVPAGAASSTGTTGAPGTVGAAGTTGTTGVPQTGSTTPGATAGYRLSGADVSGFNGQRVQIVGTFAPLGASGASTNAGTTGSAAPTAMPEFRVVSIRPIGGNCQQ